MGIWSIGNFKLASHPHNREVESTLDDDAFELQQTEDSRQPAQRSPVLRRIAVHDRYQLELKLGYPLTPGKQTRYLIDTYLFLPASLGINSSSYTSKDFYRDIQTYIRMKTPRFLMEQILVAPDSPLRRCETLLDERGEHLAPGDEQMLRDSFRVLRAVIKSAIRRSLAPLHRPSASDEQKANQFGVRLATLLEQVDELEGRYRALEPRLIRAGASAALLRSYRLADESISVLIEELLLQLHELTAQWLERTERLEWQRQLRERAQVEIDYRREHGYPSVLGTQNSEELLQRLSVLKKYTSSVLWLSTSTRREGGTLEQVLFASAAGLSMIFATLVAFYAQSTFGQISMPVFLALVIAYMFKDRIKELGRAFSTHILSRRLYDYRTSIQTQDGERDLGYVREKMIHVRPQGRERTVPPVVMAARQRDPHFEPELFGRPEVVIHYAKHVTLRKDAFRYLAEDSLIISAINDITRLDIRSFLRKMDNPYEERLALRDGRVEHVRCQRTYPLNLISVFGTEDGAATTCERTLVVLNRKGIVRIEQFEGADSAPQ
ncbi:MAG: hypothetical protein U0X20_13170 [Caldilineaceae bacterium]